MPDCRHLIEISFDLMCIAFPTHIERANPAFLSTLNYSAAELQTRTLASLAHPDDARRLAEALRGATEPLVFEGRWLTKDGATVWLRWRFHPKPDEDGVCYAVAQNVTPARTAELRFEETIEDLKRSNVELQQCAYVASHDLQEPLRMVSTYLGLLEEDLGGNLTGDQRMYMDFAVDGAKRMQKLISDLLTYSRVGRSKSMQLLDADDALDDALGILNGMIPERGATLVRSDLPMVWADRLMLCRLFLNLIGNALKFRRDDVPLQVEIYAQPTPNGGYRFAVKDNGRGFDMKYADRIFVIFQRLSNDKNGTGIGLAECRKLVERMGGRIWANSAPGEGSTFFFELLAQPPEEEG